jgi:hypothetical protein
VLAEAGAPCPWITLRTDDGKGGLRPPAAIAEEAWDRLQPAAPGRPRLS